LDDRKFAYSSKALLDHPKLQNLIAESSLHNISFKHAQHAVETFQSNGINRFNDQSFISDAITASSRRLGGDFAAFEESKFAESWNDPESPEEYDTDEINIGDSTTKSHNFGDESGDIPSCSSRQKNVDIRGLNGGHDQDDQDNEDESCGVEIRSDFPTSPHHFGNNNDGGDNLPAV
jgi:hypothetical protein